MIQFIQNMIGRMIGPSEETAARIRPWIMWGFIGLVFLTFLIYFVGGMFFFKEGPGFWTITGKPLSMGVIGNSVTNESSPINKDIVNETQLSTNNIQISSERRSPISSISKSSSYEYSIDSQVLGSK